MFVMMGWAFYLLLEGIHNRAATVCRITAVIYIAFTIGYDTAVGLNSGILVSNALSLPAAQQAIVQNALSHLFVSSAIVISYYLVLIAGIVTIGSAMWALSRAGVPRLPIFVLLGAVLAAYSHALPFGPLGSAFFFLAALWIELVWRKAPHKDPDAAINSSTRQTPEIVA